mmetsp:Transcript_47755/g.103521  ORF Transcript_47755/g.103521 Transcript_47755/m.103521 type:complete len:232 (-) Transcript_47755:176-871(-)
MFSLICSRKFRSKRKAPATAAAVTGTGSTPSSVGCARSKASEAATLTVGARMAPAVFHRAASRSLVVSLSGPKKALSLKAAMRASLTSSATSSANSDARSCHSSLCSATAYVELTMPRADSPACRPMERAGNARTRLRAAGRGTCMPMSASAMTILSRTTIGAREKPQSLRIVAKANEPSNDASTRRASFAVCSSPPWNTSHAPSAMRAHCMPRRRSWSMPMRSPRTFLYT